MIHYYWAIEYIPTGELWTDTPYHGGDWSPKVFQFKKHALQEIKYSLYSFIKKSYRPVKVEIRKVK